MRVFGKYYMSTKHFRYHRVVLSFAFASLLIFKPWTTNIDVQDIYDTSHHLSGPETSQSATAIPVAVVIGLYKLLV